VPRLAPDHWRTNNFDLIRVLASAQVAVMHVVYWFGIEAPMLALRRVLEHFPGVPIFFFISGVLVARSCASTDLRQYFRNRSLRIFPALWVCLVITLVPVVANASCSAPSRVADWLSWWFAQMSFAQMWTPDFLRGCWQNSFNGGRWTIAVELEFYLLLPLLLAAGRRLPRLWLVLLAALALASVLVQFAVRAALSPAAPAWLMILYTSLAPYLWIFLLGVVVHRYFERLLPLFAGKIAWWALGYVAVTVLAHALGLRTGGSDINPLSMRALAGLVLSAALSFRGLSDRLLRRNDLTYGLYLLHPVVLLLMTTVGLGQGMVNAVIALLLSFALAAASWFWIERPFLRRKRSTIHSHVVSK
jgi:peptidoglycan/LPS O-acetylase OafA/YrhL